jgi:hypothetical protein
MDHPSFFHSVCSTRGGDGSPLADEPSSLLGSAGNVFALPGELGLSLNDGTPRNNKLAPSSIADICRISPDTSGSKPQPEAKQKWPPTLANSQKPW